MKDKVWDSSAKKRVEKELTMDELFQDDPEAMKVLGTKKDFFDFR
jgi:hypothetical protein